MEEQEIEKKPFKDYVLKHGVILGLIHIILFLLIYLIDLNLVVSFSYMFMVLAINFGFCIYAGIQYRKENGPYLLFGKAFKLVFLILAINGLLNLILGIVIISVDENYSANMEEAQVSFSIGIAEWFGAPEEALDEAREKAYEEVKGKFTVLQTIKGYFIGLIFYAIGAAIVGLVVRKKEPEDF
ncbi:MAG: DUF4199 domain-containing protein [Cyclobacteriaceae bacterium]|nr:DUF4199 domain-containing protein [Cyclobacteriaceae bacterium]